jgi:hypothetical protein
MKAAVLFQKLLPAFWFPPCGDLVTRARNLALLALHCHLSKDVIESKKRLLRFAKLPMLLICCCFYSVFDQRSEQTNIASLETPRIHQLVIPRNTSASSPDLHI